jgi:hypothetical protein
MLDVALDSNQQVYVDTKLKLTSRNVPTEVKQCLLHSSADPQPVTPINKKNNKKTKQSQLLKLSNRLFNDATSL